MPLLEKGAILSGRYQLLALIGAGGFGSVYRASDRKTKGVVAIKVLAAQLARDAAYLRRFHREALIARSLASPHVVKVLSSGNDRDMHYLVMELIDGLTLRDVIDREGALSAADAIAIAADVAQAIAEAHHRGVVHRDIKPENIFVSADVVKVGDFGIANAEALGRMTAPGYQPGTPLYGSPEQARGEELDARSDIYSLGVVLFEMLEGHPPFTGAPLAVMDAHLHEEPLFQRPPDGLTALVRRCLAKSPADRFQSADDLLQALAEVSAHPGGSPAGARTIPTDTQGMAPIAVPASFSNDGGKRRVYLMALGGLAGLALLTVAVAGGAMLLADDPNGGAGIAAVIPTGTAVATTAASADPALAVEGADCPSRLPADGDAFALPSTEPERAVAQALNCANAAFVAAIDQRSVAALAGAMTGDALSYWEGQLGGIYSRGDLLVPSSIELLSVDVTSEDVATATTTEAWTTISSSGARSTCREQHTYGLTKSSGRWLIETDEYDPC